MSCFCVRDMVLAPYCVAYCPQIFKWMCCLIVHRPIFRYHENGLKARLTGNEWKCCVLPQSLVAAVSVLGTFVYLFLIPGLQTSYDCVNYNEWVWRHLGMISESIVTTVHRRYSVLFQFTLPWLCLGADTEWIGREVQIYSLGPVECWSCVWGHSCYLTLLPSPWHIRLNSCCELDDALWCLSRNLSQSREYGYVLCSPASITCYISGPILWWSSKCCSTEKWTPNS